MTDKRHSVELSCRVEKDPRTGIWKSATASITSDTNCWLHEQNAVRVALAYNGGDVEAAHSG